MSKSDGGLSENGAALLSYVLGWLTGLIVFLMWPYVRFHAGQSLVMFGGLHIVRALIATTFGLGWGFGGIGAMQQLGAGLLLLDALNLLALVLWIVCNGESVSRHKVQAAGGRRNRGKIGGWNALNLEGLRGEARDTRRPKSNLRFVAEPTNCMSNAVMWTETTWKIGYKQKWKFWKASLDKAVSSVCKGREGLHRGAVMSITLGRLRQFILDKGSC